MMSDSPPLQLHVNPDTKPVAVHKPVPVPIHWQAQVKAGLDQDVRLGVLEPVPIGEPVTWCSRMVVCPKKDGTPRRTVDLQSLNRAAVRQTHATESPFHQAASVPKGKLKTILDCWNGYHSVELAEADRKYTTFTTPWGSYRYKVAPQGFLAAGDAYTARFDKIVAGVSNHKKCVDDTCMWTDSLEENFHKTCGFLTLCSNAGIIFNKKKFQFAKEEVEYVGFNITKDSVKPSDTYLQAIRDFPRPRDITGIRSWFGLINQVSYAFSHTEVMKPFRDLLKPTTEFCWTQELQDAFESSKEVIIKAVEKGVKTFDMGKVTCLATDWSKHGIGFCLLQKQCNCSNLSPVCCSDGWSLVFAGSRFTSPAESRYSPVEGEALAVAWALERAKHFVLGCPTLVVAVDHKPLLKLLGDRHLEDIENPRLQNLKEKTLRYRFTLVHVPGKLHSTPDATSRNPTGTSEHMELSSMSSTPTEPNRLSKVFLAGLRLNPSPQEYEDTLEVEQKVLGSSMAALASISWEGASLNSISDKEVITWPTLEESSSKDPTIAMVVKMVIEGTPDDKMAWPRGTKEYFWCKDDLSTMGPVLLYKDRVVIPPELQAEVLSTLHSAHQGVTKMTARAMAGVYWPGMLADIERKRAACSSCSRSTPSQPSAPPTPLPQPSYPFEQICSDYFSYQGRNYIIIVDRYSGWLSIYSVGGGDNAEKLIERLKTHFLTFGISSELASDGGPTFTASATKRFLKSWGVHHRLSSAYYPHSNQRAELGVKSAKRLIRENVSPDGSLDNDSFRRALLSHRNTPDGDTCLSPAQVIFGRPIRDFIPILPLNYKPREEWRLTMEQREIALSKRHIRQEKLLREHTKTLTPLTQNAVVMVQNQTGRHALKWDKSGTIVEVLPYDQYRIKMDGSGRVSTRNRKFIRPISPYSLSRDRPTPDVDISLAGEISEEPSIMTEPLTDNNTSPALEPPVSESDSAPAPSPVRAPAQTPTQSDQPAAADPQAEPAQSRSSGRIKTPNTRLTGYVLGTISTASNRSLSPTGSQDSPQRRR